MAITIYINSLFFIVYTVHSQKKTCRLYYTVIRAF